jgi:hypothetical protein
MACVEVDKTHKVLNVQVTLSIQVQLIDAKTFAPEIFHACTSVDFLLPKFLSLSECFDKV